MLGTVTFLGETDPALPASTFCFFGEAVGAVCFFGEAGASDSFFGEAGGAVCFFGEAGGSDSFFGEAGGSACFFGEAGESACFFGDAGGSACFLGDLGGSVCFFGDFCGSGSVATFSSSSVLASTSAVSAAAVGAGAGAGAGTETASAAGAAAGVGEPASTSLVSFFSSVVSSSLKEPKVNGVLMSVKQLRYYLFSVASASAPRSIDSSDDLAFLLSECRRRRIPTFFPFRPGPFKEAATEGRREKSYLSLTFLLGVSSVTFSFFMLPFGRPRFSALLF